MSLKKVFFILITVVICMAVGALLLNIFLPNVVKQMSNAIEDSIFKATKISFDFNGDGIGGSANSVYTGTNNTNTEVGDTGGVGVEGVD